MSVCTGIQILQCMVKLQVTLAAHYRGCPLSLIRQTRSCDLKVGVTGLPTCNWEVLFSSNSSPRRKKRKLSMNTCVKERGRYLRLEEFLLTNSKLLVIETSAGEPMER